MKLPRKKKQDTRYKLQEKIRANSLPIRVNPKVLITTLAVVVAVASFMFINRNSTQAWYNESWGFRKKLTIDADKVSGSDILRDFPILVSISSDANLSANAQADGDDILFTDKSGSKLDHEIESYSSGTLVAWVRIPSLSPTTDTDIYMYYGNPSASSQQNATGVWNNNYKSVWHLNESATDEGTSTTYQDATINNIDGTQQGTASIAGKMANGQDFDGTNDRIDMTDANAHSFAKGVPFSFSAWVKLNNATQSVILSKAPASLNYNGAEYLFYTNALNQLVLNLYDGSAANYIGARTNAITAYEGSWIHVVATHTGSVDASDIQIYINGVAQSMTTLGTGSYDEMDNSSNPVRIGSTIHSTTLLNEFMNGTVDEVRIIGTRLTQDWILTEFNNQDDPSSFFSVASQESRTREPIAYWKFDEGFGTSVNDSSGNNNTGNFGVGTSAPTWKSEEYCITGKCLQFDGSNDHITVADSNSTKPTNEITVSAWIKTNSTANRQVILSKGVDWNNTYGYHLWIENTGKLLFEAGNNTQNGPTVNSLTTLEINKWYHVAATFNAGTIKIYINGELEATDATSPATITYSANTLYIGRYSSASLYFFRGFMDDVKIYPYARSADEIKQEYLGTIRGSSAVLGVTNRHNSSLSNGLIGYWDMEGIGSTASGQTVLDKSGNGNNGTTDDGANNTGMNCTLSGKFGGGCDFDGSDDLITVETSDILKNLTTQFTLSAWVKLDNKDTTNSIIFRKQNDSNNFILLQKNGLSPRSFSVSIKGSVPSNTQYTVSANSGPNNSQWYHVVGTADGTKMKLYIDGILQNTIQDIPSDFAISTSNFTNTRIGDTFLDGQIDEVRIYNRALSASEVLALYKLAPGPVGHWSFDEGNVTTANDISGNGHTGLLGTGGSAPSWSTGKYGGGLKMDGTDDYVNIDSIVSTVQNDQQGTIAAWVKPINVLETKSYVYFGVNGTVNITRFGTSADGKLIFQVRSNTVNNQVTYISDDTLTLGEWQHVAITSTGTKYQFYINGNPISATITTQTGTAQEGEWIGDMVVKTDRAAIGARRRDIMEWFFEGYMDDVRIYNYARTQEQILEDMNGGHPSVGTPVGSTVLHYSFDEGYGSTINDKSPQGNIGTLGTGSSAPVWTYDGKFGRALIFDGTNDYVDGGDPADESLDFGEDKDFTISAWAKTTSNADGRIVGKVHDGSTAGYSLRFQTLNRITFFLSDGTNTASATLTTPSYYDGNWHHILVTVMRNNASGIKMYFDGELQSATGNTTAIDNISNSVSLRIGMSQNGGYRFKGTLDEIKIYPFALTSDQVLTEYNQGKAIVLGSTSTDSTNKPLNSATAEYCVPGSTETCNPPILELNFNEKEGSIANDSSGNENNATLGVGSSAPTWSIGYKGPGLQYDGVNDYVDLGDNANFDFADGQDFTISLWLKSRSFSATQIPIGKKTGNVAGNTGWQINIGTNGKINFYAADGTDQFWRGQNGTLETNKWYHITFVFDEDNANRSLFYINGIVDAGGTTGTIENVNSLSNAQSFRIGAESDSQSFFNGFIDEVRIYNYVRTPAQIAWEYNKGAPLAHYKFDECSGTIAYDSSVNGNGDSNGINGIINIGNTSTQTAAGTCDSGNSTDAWNNGKNGKWGSSLNFDGSDDYVDLGDVSVLDSLRSMSVSAWFIGNDFDGNGDEYIVSKRTGSTDSWQLVYEDTSDTIRFTVDTGTPATAMYSDPQTGQWIHAVGTYDGSQIKLYIDGILIETINASGIMANTSDKVLIGAEPTSTPSDFFSGQIDDVRIYNYALTESQVKQLYNGGTGIRFD